MKLTAPLRRAALASEWRQRSEVHFHNGADGRAYVCDHARCDSARLSAAEVGLDR
jgi:hypothetical protein